MCWGGMECVKMQSNLVDPRILCLSIALLVWPHEVEP